MKKTLPQFLAMALGLGLFTADLSAQSEVTATLLSQISRATAGGDADFNVSFGSLNGGLASLLTKDASADGAAGFAEWYGNNSRTFLSWNTPVLGNAVNPENIAYYRYYGNDTTAESYAGGPLTSIYDSAKDNQALAFVTYSSYGTVEEVGLYAFNFTWGDPNDGASFPNGLYDIFTLASSTVTAIYGFTDDTIGDNGTIYTSTVPEPSSASLMLLGAAGVLALRRLRKNNV
jgi:hypothetical protein